MINHLIICGEEESILIVGDKDVTFVEIFMPQRTDYEKIRHWTYLFEALVYYNKIQTVPFAPRSNYQPRISRSTRRSTPHRKSADPERRGSSQLEIALDLRRSIKNRKLRRLYTHWLGKRNGQRMPSYADLNPLEIAYVTDDIMLVDVVNGRPPRFHIRLHGANLARRAGYNLTGAILDEPPETEFRRLIRQQWTVVAETGGLSTAFVISNSMASCVNRNR
jgi:hypothetical protein